MFNIADIYEKQNDISQAIEWYLQLITVCPSDANVLKRIGRVYELNGDLITACQYYQDAYRYDPSNLDVVIWLEKYYTSSDLHEKSLQFAQKATLICPNHVDYHLIVAQCFRKSGNYQRALEEYKSVHKLFPDNEEALTNLIKICTDMALDDAEHYRGKYDKLIKSNTRRRSHKKSSDGGSSRSYRYDTSETYNYNNNDTNLKTQAVPTYKNDLDESAFDTLEFDQEMLPE
ncbi:hypothetical protein A3Q56_01273 [Intoshia linei]|uniref:Uncharacterized protein n=1 Tax=Intoshia linei TaxID=1819745 RepID=A0A177BBY4_9BILA|nr:hypothetical protein A3Q56_01273 [Intoshia linei]